VLLGTIDSDTDAIKTAVQALDNAVDGNYLNVNQNIAGTDVDANSGNKGAQTQRVVIATDDIPIALVNTKLDHLSANLDTLESSLTSMEGKQDTQVTHLSEIEGAIEVIETVVKSEDSAHSSTDAGIMALAVHQTTATSLRANGDYTPLSVTSTQHLRTAKELYNFSYTFPSSGTIASGNMAESNVLTFTEKVSNGGYTFFVTSTGTANHEVGIVLKGSMDGSAYFTINSSLYATGLYNDGGTTQYFTIKDFNIKNIKIQITNNSSSSDDFEVFVCH